jgi:cobalt-zinc-cadmium resistance protein CzcA
LDLHGQTLTLEEAIGLAMKKNPSIIAAEKETASQIALKHAAVDIPKTEISLLRGQFNSIQKNDNNITITQTIPFPTVFHRQHKLGIELVASARLKEHVTRNELTFQVKQLFNDLLYLSARQNTLLQQDSLIADLLRAATLQYEAGEVSLLVKTTAETQRMEIYNESSRNDADLETTRTALRLLCQTEFDGIEGTLDSLIASDGRFDEPDQNPSQLLARQQVEIAHQQKKLDAARALPDIKVGYFNQTLIGIQTINGQDQYFGPDKRFQGFQIGLSVPLWFIPYAARTKAAAFTKEAAQKHEEANQLYITRQYHQAKQALVKNKNSLKYYRESALKTAALLRRQSHIAFKSGELDYATLLLNLKQVLLIEDGYLSTLHRHNENLITLQYLNGEN